MGNYKLYAIPSETIAPADGKKEINYEITDDAVPNFSIHTSSDSLSLFAGDVTLKRAEGNAETGELILPKPLIDGKSEGMFSFKSTYTDSESVVQRTVNMYRASGEDADSCWSKRRTFEDFDGGKYRWKTSFTGNHINCTRVSDGATIASFTQTSNPFHKHRGNVIIHQHLSPKTLQLVLITFAMILRLESRRRQIAAMAAIGASGGS
ncbi:hypothetical protein FRC03_001078 [Tulasnella sp. 419]|nr:hypothetical protein FRC03_001078 [Tulasnella sp. 419]